MQRQFRTIEDLLAYEHAPLVKRLITKEGLPEKEATELFKDTLRFLYLCGTTEEAIVPTSQIDVGWHNFILFTKDYRDFCTVFFNRFIDHVPIDQGARKQSDSLQDINRTRSAAKRVFGTLSTNWKYLQADCEPGPEQCEPTTNCQPGPDDR
jgi:hypothetical protein